MPRKLPPYEPTDEDLQWCRQVISVLNDGGMIGTSKGVYKLDKTNKKVILMSPKLEESLETFAVHHRHHYVWKALGYTVEPVVDWENLEIPDEQTDYEP